MSGIARQAWLSPATYPAVLWALLCAAPVLAQTEAGVPAPSNYGGVGLLDTRTARFLPDGYLSFNTSFVSPDDRYALTFQGLPWAEFTFRYSINHAIPAEGLALHDRSFDLKLRLVNESQYVPQIAFGMQDILGTGVYSAEYFVGSKQWGPVDMSLGLGWGRLASAGTFTNPFIIFGDRFRTRPIDVGEGGVPLFSSYFRGPDMGLFGGVSYQTPVKGVTVKVEYSSDRYVRESPYHGHDLDFPVNAGVSYRPFDWFDVGVSLMHGRDVGLRLSMLFDLKKENWPVRVDQPPRFGARAPEAQTLLSRQPLAANASAPETHYIDLTQPASASDVPSVTAEIEAHDAASSLPRSPLALDPGTAARIKMALDDQLLTVFALSVEKTTIRITVENNHYLRDAEAMARTARILSAEAPPEAEMFEITTLRFGLPLTTTTLARRELDNLARRTGSPAELFYTADLAPSSNSALDHLDGNLLPRFNWDIYPLFRQSLFDPDNPVLVELGVGVGAHLQVTRGFFLDAIGTIDIYDDYDQIKRVSDSLLPHVRSDIRNYLQQGKYALENLSASYYFKFNPNIYARVSGGYLETMFAGVGGEVLYRPFRQRWAIGADLWTVQQRSFNVLLDLRHYSALTGHVTAYYDSPWYDLVFAVSAGQYLAGDKGVTFDVSRRFLTGVTVGAWFTVTNVSAKQFGEGSFDKGIRVVIPTEWAVPFRSQSSYTIDLRPIQRDGGQRLLGDSLLYGITDSSDYGHMSEQWNSVFNR